MALLAAFCRWWRERTTEPTPHSACKIWPLLVGDWCTRQWISQLRVLEPAAPGSGFRPSKLHPEKPLARGHLVAQLCSDSSVSGTYSFQPDSCSQGLHTERCGRKVEMFVAPSLGPNTHEALAVQEAHTAYARKNKGRLIVSTSITCQTDFSTNVV